MTKKYTVSVHNGTSISRQHNVRNRAYTNSQKHIDPQGHYEVWVDESIRDAYARIFGKAQVEYNQRQSRSDRRITSYYDEVKSSTQKNVAYEMIFMIGNKDNHPNKDCSRALLYEHLQGFQRRNPNLEVTGAYYHADEEGAPHMHIDYIPVARGYKRGMNVQNGLNKALEEQGITIKKGLTPQVQLQNQERDALRELVRSIGLEVEQSRASVRPHYATDEYKARQETQALKNRQESLKNEIRALERHLLDIQIQDQFYRDVRDDDAALYWDAQLWREAKPFMQQIEYEKGQTVYQKFKEEYPGFFKKRSKVKMRYIDDEIER